MLIALIQNKEVIKPAQRVRMQNRLKSRTTFTISTWTQKNIIFTTFDRVLGEGNVIKWSKNKQK